MQMESGVKNKSLNWLFLLQKESRRFISFECRNAHSNPVLYKHEIVKLHDKISIENCHFLSKSINCDPPSFSNHWFAFLPDSHR